MTIREQPDAWLDRPTVRNAIIGIILFNAVLPGVETAAPIMDRWGGIVRALDTACLAAFVVEIERRLPPVGAAAGVRNHA